MCKKCCKQQEEKFNLLKPPKVFYHLLNIVGAVTVWLWCAFLAPFWKVDLNKSTFASIMGALPFLAAAISTPFIIVFITIFYRIYLSNIRNSFRNAFLPKTNMPKDLKRINLPDGYNFDKLRVKFNEVKDKIEPDAFVELTKKQTLTKE